MKLIILTFFTALFLGLTVAAQEDIKSSKSLTPNSFAEFETTFHSSKDLTEKTSIAQTFIKKAKREKNIIKQADGYVLIASILDNTSALKYLDSIINITMSISDKLYPAKGYLLKARILGTQSKYREAMDALTKAHHFANLNNNKDQQVRTKYYIALLKKNLGEFKESLAMLKSTSQYYEAKSDSNRYDYIKSLFALADSYNLNAKYDSASYINKKAIRLSLKEPDSILYDRHLLLSSVIQLNKKEYKAANDSINKFKKISSSKEISDGNMIRSELFLGKILLKQNQTQKGIYHLEKVDSIAFSKKHFFPTMRETYELLIQHYKSKKNVEKQLTYINKLLHVDSIINKDFKYLYKEIDTNYSTPILLSEKQELIQSLKKSKKDVGFIATLLSIVTLLLIVFLYLNIKKKKKYQQRFMELLKEDDTSKIEQNKKPSTKTTAKLNPNDLGISDVIINEILKNLNSFEEKKSFLKPNLTVGGLSKEFKTNSKYLSKVINYHKDKSFNNYINDLRINFVVQKLKNDTKFRRYTIKAIASEIGFNTTEAFSKSFYKNTGIYPSFFVKQLESEQQKTNLQQVN